MFQVREISHHFLFNAVYVVSSFSALDRVSCMSELAKAIPASRISTTALFVTLLRGLDIEAVLYHCQIDKERRTYLRKRKWPGCGLCEYQLCDDSFQYNYDITTVVFIIYHY